MDAGSGIGMFAGAMMLLFLPLLFLGLGLTVFWVWMIVDCVTNETSEGNEKLVWLLVVILTGWLGALIYFFARKQKRAGG